MGPVEALTRLGGVGGTAEILTLTSRRALRTAVARGEVRRLTRGRYGLLEADGHRCAAAQAHGLLSHLSAAQHWGWPVAWPPDQP